METKVYEKIFNSNNDSDIDYKRYLECKDLKSDLFKIYEKSEDEHFRNPFEIESSLSELVFNFDPERHFPKFKSVIQHYLKIRKDDDCSFDKVRVISEVESSVNMELLKGIISSNFIFNKSELSQINKHLENLDHIGPLKWILSAAFFCFKNWDLKDFNQPPKLSFTIPYSKEYEILKEPIKNKRLMILSKFVNAVTCKNTATQSDNTLTVVIEYDHIDFYNIFKMYYTVVSSSKDLSKDLQDDFVIMPFSTFTVEEYNAEKKVLRVKNYHYHPLFDVVYDFVYDLRCNTLLVPNEQHKLFLKEKIKILEALDESPKIVEVQKLREKLERSLFKLYKKVHDFHSAKLLCNKVYKQLNDIYSPGDYKIAWQLIENGILKMKLHLNEESINDLEEAIKMLSEKKEENNLDKAFAYNLIGENYWILDNYPTSINYLEMGLEIRKKILGDYHPDVALSLSNLGVGYEYKGDVNKALEIGEKALECKIQLYGHDSIETSISYNNVATCRGRLGDIIGSIDYHNKSLDIKSKLLGPFNNHVAISYINLGKICFSNNDIASAIYNYEKACEIWEKIGDNRITDMAQSYDRLYGIYIKDKMFIKASNILIRKTNSFLGLYSKEQISEIITKFLGLLTSLPNEEIKYNCLIEMRSTLSTYYESDDTLFDELKSKIQEIESTRSN